MRTLRFHPTLAAAAFALLGLIAPCSAQQIGPANAALPAAGAARTERTDRDLRTGQGWVILADADGRGGGAELHHAPPEDATRKVTAATLRPVAPLTARPEFMAAIGDRVYLATGQRISSVRAFRITGPGGWDYLPRNDTVSEPPLPDNSTILGLAGSPFGPAALTRSPAGEFDLQILGDDGWLRAPLPTLPRSATLQLLGTPGGLRLLEQPATGPVRIWDGKVTVERGADPGPDDSSRSAGKASIEWKPAGEFALPPELVRSGDARPLAWRAATIDRALVVWAHHGTELLIWAAHAGRLVPVQTVPGVPDAFAVLPLVDDGLLRIYWVDRPAGRAVAVTPAARTAIDAATVQVREVSTSTGRLLYSGGLKVGGIISHTDFTLLTLGLCAAMSAALIFIVRGGPRPPIVLPDGAALAPPGRRLVAWFLDFVPAVVACGIVFNLAPSAVIAGFVTGDGEYGAIPLLVALAIAAAHSAICEAVWGRSLGKLLMGLDVVAMQRVPASTEGESAKTDAAPAAGSVRVTEPFVWQAVVRSAIRFLLFPLAGLLLMDPNWRHPGDILARTVVIERAEEPDEPEE
ncbi:MAG: RDD family protein [Phycisphaerales bacterium]